MARTSKPLRVVYIAGYGRSGSTLLDIVLGQHSQIMGAGEITTLSRHVWPNNEYCSCGQRAADCSLWGAIGRKWMQSSPPTAPLKTYERLQGNIEAIASPLRLFRRSLFRKSFEAYAERTVDLLDQIRSHAGKEIIVDSSKLPGRAWALAAIPEIELVVIHLVRDGRGVASSLLRSYEVDAKAGVQKKLNPKSAVRTAARWCVVNIAAEMLRWRLGPENYLRVKYEDFIVDPAGVLERIGTMVGADFSPISAALVRGDAIQPFHQIAGSRLRMSKSIRLAREDTWRAHLSPRQRAAFELFGGWLLRRYAYPIDVHPRPDGICHRV